MQHSKLLILLIFMVFVASCSTSPTGRGQLIFKSDAELEAQSRSQFNAMKATMALATDRAKIDFVACVARPLRLGGGVGACSIPLISRGLYSRRAPGGVLSSSRCARRLHFPEMGSSSHPSPRSLLDPIPAPLPLLHLTPCGNASTRPTARCWSTSRVGNSSSARASRSTASR